MPAALQAAQQRPDDALVSPGLAGFLTVFALALALVVLLRSMVKHLRNVRYGPGPDGTGPGPGLGREPRRAPATPPPEPPPGPEVPPDGTEPPAPTGS
jgi:hypothetical protein